VVRTNTLVTNSIQFPFPAHHDSSKDLTETTRLAGKVGVGLDWGLTDRQGVFSPDALYTLHTDDNATVLVFEKGHAPHVHILFETASSQYAWLNSAVAYATGGPNDAGVALDVWQVSSDCVFLLPGAFGSAMVWRQRRLHGLTVV
jgi:hypothetical protein